MIFLKKKRTRFLIVSILIIVTLTILLSKLTYVKIIKSEEYYEKAIDLWTRSAPIRGTRGNIYDCNGKLIVGNYLTPSLVCIPKQVDNPARTATIISSILKTSRDKILKHLTKNVSVEIIKPEGQKLDVTTAIKRCFK